MAGLVRDPPPPASTIYVGNLSFDLSEQEVADYFTTIGPIKSIKFGREQDTGKPRGFAFVEFYDIPTAESAVRNLNQTELNGRPIKVLFADSNKKKDENPVYRSRPTDAPQQMGGAGNYIDPRARRAEARNKLVGGDLAYHSSQGMGVLLGQPILPNAPADQLTSILARKTRSELYEYLAQMQTLLRQHPQHARKVLLDNPRLARALFQMEIILGMVSNPLGDVAPKGIAPPMISSMAGHQQQQPPPRGESNYQPAAYAPAGTPQQQHALDPRLQQKNQPPVDPRRALAGGGQMGGTAPRPMVSAVARAAAAAASIDISGGAEVHAPESMPMIPGMTPEQQQALLQQVMSLTPEQIELLPPEQKAQVVALQQQIGSRA